MSLISRKTFLLQSGTLAAALMSQRLFTQDLNMRLSFSTLGCPDWSFPEILAFASVNGFEGIEIRGIKRELDLVKCPEFNTPAARKSTLAAVREKKLAIVGLGSSCNLHIVEKGERTKNMDEAKRFIELAHDIECPYIRVFPNKFPEGLDKKAAIDLISAGLKELGEFAGKSGVRVLMETHGDVVYIDDLLAIMKNSFGSNTGLLWDVSNMWTVTKEKPADVYAKLKPYIFHTHIKDAKLVNSKPVYTLIGRGEVPILDAIQLLRDDQYKGYYSFEWEKLWHPEIDAPEIAIADFPKALKSKFGN